MQIKYIVRHNYFSQNKIYVNEIDNITDWFSSIINEKGIFCSLRWYKNTPTTKKELISKLHNILNKLFQKLLGSHWFKLYKKHFNLVIIKEQGQSFKNYHAHIILGIKSNKFEISDIIKTFNKIEKMIQMEIYLKNDTKVNLLHTYPDNIVITPIYDINGVSKYITKEFDISKYDFQSRNEKICSWI